MDPNPKRKPTMNTIALIATRKGLFQLNDKNQIKEVGFLGVPVSMVLANKRHSNWYAALDHGHFGVKIHRSDDAGKNWREITVPSYPKAQDAAEGDSLALIWSLAYADPGNPQALWAGTIPGGLFHSNDGGESWQLNIPLSEYRRQQNWIGGGYDHPGIHSICVHPEDHRQVKVAVSCAGVWETKDSGDTWHTRSQGMRAEYMPPEKQFEPTIQDPHLLVQCQARPDLLWSQHHNGIFHSMDNAESWQEIKNVSPSAFGFTVSVHPFDGNTAWFVPGVKDECRIPVDGRLVVTRTRDGGETFETLTNGLPQNGSYDLVFRHGMDIDISGEQLLMGSTTGNLWKSDDQGDNWRCLSNHLPPIFAVRFVK